MRSWQVAATPAGLHKSDATQKEEHDLGSGHLGILSAHCEVMTIAEVISTLAAVDAVCLAAHTSSSCHSGCTPAMQLSLPPCVTIEPAQEGSLGMCIHSPHSITLPKTFRWATWHTHSVELQVGCNDLKPFSASALSHPTARASESRFT